MSIHKTHSCVENFFIYRNALRAFHIFNSSLGLLLIAKFISLKKNAKVFFFYSSLDRICRSLYEDAQTQFYFFAFN